MSIPMRCLENSPKRSRKPVEEKVAEIKTAFLRRGAADQKRIELVTDTEYWCCVCFENREQKEAFLRALGLLEIGDKYIDGIKAASKLGVDIGPRVEWPKTKGLSERMIKHVIE